MAEYNRFVSYVYAYENNKKTLNNGFARVETRDNTCSVYVHMKELYGDSHTKYRVYMVKRTERGLTGIYLGKASRVQNQGEFNCRITKDNINDSGISLIEIAGIIILGDNGRKYGTCWDDEPLDMELFAEQGTGGHEAAVLNSTAGRQKTADSKDTAGTISEAVAGRAKFVIGRWDEVSQSDTEEQSNEANETAEVISHEERKENLNENTVVSEEKNTETGKENLKLEKEKSEAGEENLKSEKEKSEAGEEKLKSEKEESGAEKAKFKSEEFMYGTGKENYEAEPYKELMAESIALSMPSDGEAASFFSEPLMSGGFMENNENGNKDERKQQSMAKRLGRVLESGIKMYPFEDNEIDSCIRLEIQDIGMLPMKFWIYAGNSFVLHSYYSYRHLILARKKDGSYILGVPGMGEKKDSFMAQMFGFNTFKAIREKSDDLSSSDFGYWYVKLL